MNRPDNILVYDEMDLKLGIKSISSPQDLILRPPVNLLTRFLIELLLSEKLREYNHFLIVLNLQEIRDRR